MPLSALAFILIFVVGCALAIFVDAYYGILLYVFAYFALGRWWGIYLPDLRYPFIIAIVIMAAYLIRSGRYSENKVFDAPQTKWYLLICAVIILTYPIAVDKVHHLQFMVVFVNYTILYLLIIKVIDTPDKFNKLIGVFLLGQFYMSWLARDFGRTGAGRLENLGGPDCRDANGSAALIIAAVPIAIHYLIMGKKWQKICALPLLAFMFNTIILINSRGAFIALLVSMGYYFFVSLKSPSFSKFNKTKLLPMAFAGVALFVYLADPIFIDRMTTISNPETEEIGAYTGRERIGLWFTTFDILGDYPLGTGAMGYDYVSSQYLPEKALNPTSRTRAVHSMYFQVLSEYGYHGSFLFIMFLYSNFRYLWKLRKSFRQRKVYEPYYLSIALEAGFLAFLITGIFINIFYMEIMCWMAAFFAAYGNIYFKQLKQIDDNVAKEELPDQRFPEAGFRRNYT